MWKKMHSTKVGFCGCGAYLAMIELLAVPWALLELTVRHLPTTSAATKAVTCDAGVSVDGSEASVTCHLSEVRGLESVSVVQYAAPGWAEDGGSSSSSEREALMCIKNAGMAEKVCSVSVGFVLPQPQPQGIPEDLRIVIPAVSSGFAGLYACKVIPSEAVQVHMCRLSVKERPRDTTDIVNTTQSIIEELRNCNKSLEEAKVAITRAHSWIRTLGSLTAAVIFTGLMFSMMFLLVKMKRECQVDRLAKTGMEKSQPDTEMTA